MMDFFFFFFFFFCIHSSIIAFRPEYVFFLLTIYAKLHFSIKKFGTALLLYVVVETFGGD